jgi:hypothetical protein
MNMIIDSTIQTPEVKRKMSEKVGEPYGFIERLKMRGVGSKRMRIHSASEHFEPFFSNQQDSIYCNIELRKAGIVVHFKKYQTLYSWLIPNGSLRIKSGEYYTLKAENHTLLLKKDRLFTENKVFLERIE